MCRDHVVSRKHGQPGKKPSGDAPKQIAAAGQEIIRYGHGVWTRPDCRSFVLTRSCSVKAGARLPDNKRFPKAPAQVTDPLNLRTFSVISFRTPDRAEVKIPKVPHEHITNNEKISHAGILYKREINTKFAENHICYYHRRRK